MDNSLKASQSVRVGHCSPTRTQRFGPLRPRATRTPLRQAHLVSLKIDHSSNVLPLLVDKEFHVSSPGLAPGRLKATATATSSSAKDPHRSRLTRAEEKNHRMESGADIPPRKTMLPESRNSTESRTLIQEGNSKDDEEAKDTERPMESTPDHSSITSGFRTTRSERSI